MLLPVFSTDLRLRSKNASGDPFAWFDRGVPQPACILAVCSAIPPCRLVELPGVSFQSLALGVTHGASGPVEALSDVRRAEARSAGIDRPDGVVRSFQVSVYKVEPTEAVLACNLLAKDCVRAALRDETEEVGPEVSLVVETSTLAGGAERLTWARTGPNRTLVTPPGAAQGVAPDADPGEEVALGVTTKVIGFHVLDAALVDIAGCDVSGLDKLAQPRRRERVKLVVVGTHICQLNRRGGEGGALS